MRLLMAEPNVLLLDEPTNDLDIDTLTALEDLLDSWPGTLVVVSHDRYFVERVVDNVYAISADGGVQHLPGGLEQYVDERRAANEGGDQRTNAIASVASFDAQPSAGAPSNQELRQAKKDVTRLERQLVKLDARMVELHEQMAAAATDHARLAELEAERRQLDADRERTENEWLEASALIEA